MKTMKKLSILCAVTFLLSMLLTGCWKAAISSDMEIGANFEGKKTITGAVLKDHVAKPDGKGNVDDNSKYLKGGFVAFGDWLKANAPKDVEFSVKEEADQFVYTISYSFKSLEEYNEKTKKIVGEQRYNDLGLAPATFTKAEGTNSNGEKGYNVTFKESKDVLYAVSAWAIEGMFNDPKVFDPDPAKTGAIGITDTYELKNIKVKIGETVKEFDLTAQQNVSLTEIEASGFVKAKAEPVAEAKSSNTTLYIGIAAGVVAVLVVAGVFVVISKKKKNGAAAK